MEKVKPALKDPGFDLFILSMAGKTRKKGRISGNRLIHNRKNDAGNVGVFFAGFLKIQEEY